MRSAKSAAFCSGADSLDAVELIMAIEEAFDIEIPDEEAEKMTTPADCVPGDALHAGCVGRELSALRSRRLGFWED